MGIRIENTGNKRNWTDFATNVAEIVIQALVLGPGGFSNAISAFMRAIRNLKGEAAIDKRATQLVLATLAYAISGVLSKSRLRRPPGKLEAKVIIENFLNRALLLAQQEEILLDSSHIEYPPSFPLFRDAEAQLLHELKDFASRGSKKNLIAEFQKFVSEGFNRIRIREPDYYNPVFEMLEGSDAKADLRIRSWDHYRALLIKRFEEDPLFGEDPNSGVTLGQVYQPLRAWWDEHNEEEEAQSTKARPHKISRHVGMLDQFVQEWLETNDRSDRIRLISGGPGSGKSTYAKWLACSLANELRWRVLFVPLQRLRGTGALENRIDDYFRLQTDEPFNADITPLSSLGRDEHRDWVVIFDGLDELTKEGGGSESAALDFASALSDWRGRVGATSVRFIVLGRAPSMQNARRRLGLQGQGTLYVSDMVPFTRNRPEVNFHDPNKLMDKDQRPEFWVKWATAKGLGLDVPEAVVADALSDLTKEPLLAYLLYFSGFVGDRWKEAAENRNRIYAGIFRQIWERERSKLTRIRLNDLGRDGFEALMQALGLAAWRGGGRTGDEPTFTMVRDIFMQQSLLRRAKDCGAAELGNVAILFYTRKDEGGGRGYEFLHKSFGEYLTAKGLLNAFIRWGNQVDDQEGDFGAADFLRRWILLAGPGEITREILVFLRDEVRLKAYETNSNMPWEAARKWVSIAGQLLNLAVVDGLPAHEGATRWREAETKEINGEVSLMALLDALGRAAYPSSLRDKPFEEGGWNCGPIEIPAFIENAFEFGQFIKRNCAYRELGGVLWYAPRRSQSRRRFGIRSYSIVYEILLRLSLQGNYLPAMDFMEVDLEGANLSGAMLINSDFAGANLRGACFRSARLDMVNFGEADLSNADLRGAITNGTDFTEAKLIHAKVDGEALRKE